jgi:hypothetical protein
MGTTLIHSRESKNVSVETVLGQLTAHKSRVFGYLMDVGFPHCEMFTELEGTSVLQYHRASRKPEIPSVIRDLRWCCLA